MWLTTAAPFSADSRGSVCSPSAHRCSTSKLPRNASEASGVPSSAVLSLRVKSGSSMSALRDISVLQDHRGERLTEAGGRHQVLVAGLEQAELGHRLVVD